MATGGGESEMAAADSDVGAGEETPSASRSASRRFFVALHVGAGFHAPANEKAYRRAMKRACLAAAAVLREVRSLNPNPFTLHSPVSPSSCLLSWFGMACGLDFSR